MDSIEELPKRIIKFIAWDKVTKTWFRNGDGFSIDWDASHITDDNDIRVRTDPTIVLMQFTGLLDKNGKEIYEHDRVRVLYTDWPSKDSNDPRTLEQYLIDISRIGVVVFHGLGWCLKFDGDRYDTLIVGTHGRLEVIGTIYQS